MKKSLLICVFMAPVVGYTQISYFNNRYNILNHDAAVSIVTTDSSYLCGGVVDLTNDWRIGLMELDLSGNVKWEKTYGSSGLQYSAGGQGSLIKIFDGGYALGGGRNSGINASNVGMLWYFDANGDTLWTNWFGSTTNYFETFYQCKQTPDSGFILIGVTNKTDTNGDIWLVKTDKDGNFEWDTTYGGAGVEYGFSVDMCFDGGYILGGYTKSFGAGDVDAYVIKTDDTGMVQWSKTFGDIYLDGYAVVLQTSDSGYIVGTSISKYIMSTFYNQNQSRLVKLNNNGDIVWDKTYGEERYGTEIYAVHEINNGNFVAVGQRANRSGTPPGNGWINGLILKVNNMGDSLWYRVHEYDTCEKNDDYFRDMKPTSDGGFIVAGFFTPNTSIQCNDTGTQDMWVMKLDSCGCLVPYCDTLCTGPPPDTTGIYDLSMANEDFGIFPNPTGGEFIVEIHSSATLTIHNKIAGKPYKITVYDILGREIKRIVTNSNKTHVDISASRNGIYFVQVNDGSGSHYSSRVVKY